MQVTLKQLSNKDFRKSLQGDFTGFLQKAVDKNAWEEVLKLLNSKGKLNVNVEVDSNGNTPLHRAVLFGQKEIVELLIQKGADVNKENNYKSTPLHVAARWNSQKEIVELLIKAGADVNKENIYGSTPLHEAVVNGQEIVELLIKASADVNKENKNKDIPIDLATYYGRKDIVLLLADEMRLPITEIVDS